MFRLFALFQGGQPGLEVRKRVLGSKDQRVSACFLAEHFHPWKPILDCLGAELTDLQFEKRAVVETANILPGTLPGTFEGVLQMPGVGRYVSRWSYDGRTPRSLFRYWLLAIQS